MGMWKIKLIYHREDHEEAEIRRLNVVEGCTIQTLKSKASELCDLPVQQLQLYVRDSTNGDPFVLIGDAHLRDRCERAGGAPLRVYVDRERPISSSSVASLLSDSSVASEFATPFQSQQSLDGKRSSSYSPSSSSSSFVDPVIATTTTTSAAELERISQQLTGIATLLSEEASDVSRVKQANVVSELQGCTQKLLELTKQLQQQAPAVTVTSPRVSKGGIVESIMMDSKELDMQWEMSSRLERSKTVDVPPITSFDDAEMVSLKESLCQLDDTIVGKVNHLEQMGYENRTLSAFLLTQLDGDMEAVLKQLQSLV